MTKMIKALAWAGSWVSSPFAPPQFIRPQAGDFARDTLTLRRDMGAVGNDMRRAIQAEKQQRKK